MELYSIGIGARVKHPSLGEGVVYDLDTRTIHIFFKEHGEQTISRSFTGLEVTAPGPDLPEAGLDMAAVEEALEQVLERMNAPQRPVEMARKYEGGTLELRPKYAALKGKEVPIDDLFHKVVMIRDRFRVLEQKINAHPALSEVDKVELQQYITRCYGSLTTFNILFEDKEDHFVGQRGDPA